MHLQSNIHVPIIYTSAHAYAYACTHVSSIAVHTVVLYSSAHCSRTCFSRTCSASTPYYAIYTCLGTAHRSGLVIHTVHVIYTEESGRDLHRGEETNANPKPTLVSSTGSPIPRTARSSSVYPWFRVKGSGLRFRV